MIPLSQQRAADRRRHEAYIAAVPSAARFRTMAVNVRLSEPAKARAMRLGGFDPGFTAECVIVLPLGEKPPEADKELIDVQDLSGATQTYDIASSTALLGTCCYRLALRARRSRARSATPGQ